MTESPSATDRFIQTARLLEDCADLFAEPLQAAAQTVLQALMGDGKLLAAGSGVFAALADILCAYMVARADEERMGLAAVSLGGAALAGRLAETQAADAGWARHVHALGRPNDVLCVMSADGCHAALEAAVAAAHERDMPVLALTGADGGRLAAMLRDSDILLNVPTASAGEVLEVHTATVHALCREIDRLLLGGL